MGDTTPKKDLMSGGSAGNNFLTYFDAASKAQSTKSSSYATPGNTAPLSEILKLMMASSDEEGMNKLVQQIFKQGFEKQAPSLLNAANQTGVRGQDSTTNALLTNDLIARLTGEATTAVGEQQARTAQAAIGLAEQTKSNSTKSKTGFDFGDLAKLAISGAAAYYTGGLF